MKSGSLLIFGSNHGFCGRKTWESYSEQNAIKVMINSGGTRASKDQVKQLAAMRGLVVDPLGNIVEMPTKSNFRKDCQSSST